MKKIFRTVAAVCAISLLSGCSMIGESEKAIKKKEAENAIVTIDGESYSKERFSYYFYNEQDELLTKAGITDTASISKDFWQQKTDGKTALEIAKENALAAMVEDVLKYKKAINEGIKLTTEEQNYITSQIGQMKQNDSIMSQIKQIGTDIETYTELYTESRYIQKLIMKYVEEGKIKVDEAAAKSEFESKYVKAKHILFLTQDNSTNQPLSDEEIAKKKELAEQTLAKIRAGGDFDELMNQYSEDPGLKSAPDGYVFTNGQMVQEFEDSAFSLKENQVSGIVQTSYGYHIIKRVPFDMNGTQEKEYMSEIEYNMATPEVDKLTKKWKADAKIDINDKIYDAVKPTIVNNGTSGNKQ